MKHFYLLTTIIKKILKNYLQEGSESTAWNNWCPCSKQHTDYPVLILLHCKKNYPHIFICIDINNYEIMY